MDRLRIDLGWVLGGSRSPLAVSGCGFPVTVVGRGGRGLWEVWVWVLVVFVLFCFVFFIWVYGYGFCSGGGGGVGF